MTKISSQFMENKNIKHWKHFFIFFKFCQRDFSLKNLKAEDISMCLM